MNPIAAELNAALEAANPHLLESLSAVGRALFFPRGILSQSAEAKEQAHRFNATIGIATEGGHAMALPSVTRQLPGFSADEALTYAPSFGLPELRRRWRETLYEKNPSLAGHTVSLPVVTQAITHGLSTVADLFVDPGDVLLLPELMWGNYRLIFAVRRGARVATYPLFAGGGFNTAGLAEALRRAGGERGKAVVLLNFPNNPTGYTPREAEAEAIVAALVAEAERGTNLVVVADDAYFGLVYAEGCLTESIFARLAGRHPRLLPIKLDGATKENYVWGLRVGFLTYAATVAGDPGPAHDALERKTAGDIRGTISNASRLSQQIVLRALEDPAYAAEREEKYRLMRARAEEVRRVLADPKYAAAWEAYPFNSGYFMCLRLKRVEAEPLRRHLLAHHGVGLIALGSHDLRVAFSCLEVEQVRPLFDTVLAAEGELAAGGGVTR
ncbi:MAG: aminotransferase class I/II-fold pyridoxal phosphate-dependent enzyme [Nitrospirae bacterium]|nr:MAG: aminotransferase class I/II-fold pyridoxal phosphate-dependent enzyme [Nitrospirota bacterium]